MTCLELVQYAQAEGDAVRAHSQQRHSTAFLRPKGTPTHSAKTTGKALYAETVKDSRLSSLMQQEQSEMLDEAVHYLYHPE